MHLHTRNINTAFRDLVHLFRDGERDHGTHMTQARIVRKQSRNGPVLMIEEPVTITYKRPIERVLLNPARDANAAFHLYEAMWMLAGRNDLAPLQYYVKDFGKFSDDGKTLNGAYGYRWRHAERPNKNIGCYSLGLDVDQLDIIVNHLNADPNSRRAVLQMWNVEDDLLKITDHVQLQNSWGKDATPMIVGTIPASKDVCCNLSVMFAIRQTEEPTCEYGEPKKRSIQRAFLDMTVTNRSNDLIWGCLGANYVHFTFLQEYMARRLGVKVGVYNHFTNNLHVYEWNWEPDEWLAAPVVEYPSGGVPFDADDDEIKEFAKVAHSGQDVDLVFTSNFLEFVAKPMYMAHNEYKNGNHVQSLNWANTITDPAWKQASLDWLQRRIKVQS